MKTCFLLASLFFLSCSALAQEVVKPIRVSVTALSEDQHDKQLVDEFRGALRNLRYIEISERQSQWNIFLTATPITENGQCPGYALAILVVNKDSSPWMHIYTGMDLQSLAQHLVENLEQRFFRPPRAAVEENTGKSGKQ